MRLYCSNGCTPAYKTREFHRQPDETHCPNEGCGGRLETGMQRKAKQRGRGGPASAAISPASEAQRAKVKDQLSIISAKAPCDPMHIWDRRLGGCDDALCVVPATRFEHRDYEEKRLDILPALIAGGYFAEMAHVVEVHEVSPTRLVERLTGQTYGPVDYLTERILELETGAQR